MGGRVGPRVWSGQTFCRQSQVGSGRVNVSPGRVGSKKSDPWTTLRHRRTHLTQPLFIQTEFVGVTFNPDLQKCLKK